MARGWLTAYGISILGVESLKAQRKVHDERSTWSPTWQVVDKGCMVCQNLCQAHLQEVGLTQIPTNHGIETTIIGCHG
jgi:hypothetical protein